MAIMQYEKEGTPYYRVYVQAISKKDRSYRVQKNKFKLVSLPEAQKEEKKLIKYVSEQISLYEGRGMKWCDIVERWEVAARFGQLGECKKNPRLIADHVNRLKRYTKPWLNMMASELSVGDGRLVINYAKEHGATAAVLAKLKVSINVVYKWGLEEKLIVSQFRSPVEGVDVRLKSEKLPKILSLEEVRKFITEAKNQNHPWYPIWAFAFFTGMRSGELMALQWKDIDFEKKNIVVSKSCEKNGRILKSTKAGYWRNVPISNDLQKVIELLKSSEVVNPDGFVLKRNAMWVTGNSGKVLRKFLQSIGIDKNIVFHTLRACFATHMLASGCDQATVMKIGGWCDLKTFQIYVRLSGVETSGATNILDFDM